jgi:hypothetical protein
VIASDSANSTPKNKERYALATGRRSCPSRAEGQADGQAAEGEAVPARLDGIVVPQRLPGRAALKGGVEGARQVLAVGPKDRHCEANPCARRYFAQERPALRGRRAVQTGRPAEHEVASRQQVRKPARKGQVERDEVGQADSKRIERRLHSVGADRFPRLAL